ncbi:hypothetical protein, partial [uncultured Porphyromonas sp.]|uniref:hypothetical protein n=1 Tax=uncultured Porphyromonas sp. TaxID=159274 RepID=UPI0028065B8C
EAKECDKKILPPARIPRKRTQRRILGDCTGATPHPYHTTRRLTPSASAPFVVSYALMPRYALHKCGSREL